MEGWDQTTDSWNLLSEMGYSLESSFVYTSIGIKKKKAKPSKLWIFKLYVIFLSSSTTGYLENNVF